MAKCKPCSTPVDLTLKLSPTIGALVAYPTDYRSLDGALQYLMFTRLYISYEVQQVCLYMHDPREPHLAALKWILRYIHGTLHLGLVLRPSLQCDQVVYFDANWASFPDTCKSTSGYAVLNFLVTILSLGLPNIIIQFLGPVRKLNIKLLLTLLLKPPSCASYSSSCILHLSKALWSIVITSALSTCLQTLSSINAPNILRLTFTLFATRCCW